MPAAARRIRTEMVCTTGSTSARARQLVLAWTRRAVPPTPTVTAFPTVSTNAPTRPPVPESTPQAVRSIATTTACLTGSTSALTLHQARKWIRQAASARRTATATSWRRPSSRTRTSRSKSPVTQTTRDRRRPTRACRRHAPTPCARIWQVRASLPGGWSPMGTVHRSRSCRTRAQPDARRTGASSCGRLTEAEAKREKARSDTCGDSADGNAAGGAVRSPLRSRPVWRIHQVRQDVRSLKQDRWRRALLVCRHADDRPGGGGAVPIAAERQLVDADRADDRRRQPGHQHAECEPHDGLCAGRILAPRFRRHQSLSIHGRGLPRRRGCEVLPEL